MPYSVFQRVQDIDFRISEETDEWRKFSFYAPQSDQWILSWYLFSWPCVPMFYFFKNRCKIFVKMHVQGFEFSTQIPRRFQHVHWINIVVKSLITDHCEMRSREIVYSAIKLVVNERVVKVNLCFQAHISLWSAGGQTSCYTGYAKKCELI
jgi:hypothetical protein